MGAACRSSKHYTRARRGMHMEQCSAVLHIIAIGYQLLLLLKRCLAHGITVIALDLSGSGHSDGDDVSLSHFEQYYLETVVSHLKNDPSVFAVAAWGWSMGAATALLYATRHPTHGSAASSVAPSSGDLSLAGIIVDSAFVDL